MALHAGDNALDFELDLAGSIEGHVFDERGQPLAGVQVHADCVDCAGSDSGDDVTAADGHFIVTALMGTGSYAFAVVTMGEGAHRLEPASARPPVRVKDGNDHVSGVRLDVRTPSSR